MSLGDLIANKVIEKFNNLTVKNGKPIIRSNGVEEWTVLASIVIIDGDEIEPITLTTGVKSLPDEFRQFSNGTLVQDCHAEILSIRLFNYFLLKEFSNSNSKIVVDGKFRDDLKLALFVSEPPCGDASMNYVLSNMKDSTIWQVKESTVGINRGRDNFGQLGLVRTKPGRSDSLIALSKSCSDKLCVKQVMGINSAITSELYEPIFIDYLVIKNLDQVDFDRCFNRLRGNNFKLLTYNNDDYKFNKADGKAPAIKCLIHLIPTNETQILNNGVKNGSVIKDKNLKFKSFLCNKLMMEQLKQVKQVNHTTYLEFKQSNKSRQELKKQCREILQNWICTSYDNFNI
ncbi:unnamed protein product [Candida verbasci]|uniref:A to I editase domain-containing protein n=1 Tax=Candida verbasci TaxID=1227364 RepID=A0A9W4XIG5_9ASCO|nr:unnamed protein product [Candida verbasci]